MGCFTMLIIGLVALALVIGGTWWAFNIFVAKYTSTERVNVETAVVTDAQLQEATNKLSAVRAAGPNATSTTVVFTAADLNALIARHPDFEDMRGKFRVGMADSILTLEMSVPLREIELPGMKRRWFNGTARMGFAYNDENFDFALRSIEANGRTFPLGLLQGLASFLNRSFNDRFERDRHENERTDQFWRNVKSLAVLDDKLVVITKGPEKTDNGL
jgi:hypothetical protein